MNKNRFSEIFRCKEFAGSRAEKAHGCVSSSLVSKIVLYLNCSFGLRMFQLSTVEQQIVLLIYQLKNLAHLSFATRIFKAELQS